MNARHRAIEVFGRRECADTVRSRALLERRGLSYAYSDVELDESARASALTWSGVHRVPVVVIDGALVLVEPSDDELDRALSG